MHTNQSSRLAGVLAMFVVLCAATIQVAGAADVPQTPPVARASTQAMIEKAIGVFRNENPGADVLIEDGRVSRVFGPAFATGESAIDTAERFLARHAGAIGAEAEHLLSGNRRGTEVQPLVFDRETGTYKFTAVYRRHVVDGVEVFDSYATLLMRNEPGHPCVLVVSDIRPVGDFRPPVDFKVDPLIGQLIARGVARGVEEFTDTRLVIWADDGLPRLAYAFEGHGFDPIANMLRHELFVFDAMTHGLLLRRNLILHDASGNVSGRATPGLLPDTEENEPVLTALPNAFVFDKDDPQAPPAVTDSDGDYEYISQSQITLRSVLEGPWAVVHTMQGDNLVIDKTASPPSEVNFGHNRIPDEFSTAQVNAFFHTNLVRDFVVSVNPAYPGMHEQLSVFVNVLDPVCNAQFVITGPSLRFYGPANGSCGNRAYSTVVQHEYGHYMIWLAGTAQAAYGEGMSDSIAIIVTDQPGVLHDWDGPETGPLRSGDSEIEFPCVGCSSGDIHCCGQVLSGVVWNLREILHKKDPGDYHDIVSTLTVNSILLNPPGITPGLLVDFLTLDDDDSNILNGTPNMDAIVDAFDAKGFPPLCPWREPVTVHVPGDYSTIQAAINSFESRCVLPPGAEILVAPGTYNEAINLHGKAIQLRSTDGPGVTIIDATGLDTTVITCENAGPSTVVEGFTITGGNKSGHGGGMFTSGNPTVIDCVFVGNQASWNGGGLYNPTGGTVVIGCTFENNTASNGGAIYHTSSIHGSHSIITDSVFVANTASADYGGAIWMHGWVKPRISGCTFDNNSSGFAGGAIAFGQALFSFGAFGSATIESCYFSQNTTITHAQGGGGAVYVAPATPDHSFPTIIASEFCENDPEDIKGSWNDGGDNEFPKFCP